MKRENTLIAAAKRGFTLVELLVVVAIIGILGTIAIQNVTEHLKTADSTAAKAQVQQIAGAVTSYYMKYHKMPTDLKQLIDEQGDNAAILEGGEGALIDPWDNEYQMRKGKGKDKIYIISAGPDGSFDTEDDIRSDKIDKKPR